MFTGIVQAVGSVREIEPREAGVRMYIDAGTLGLDDINVGDSVAINGVCLTVAAIDTNGLTVDVSPETLRCTTLGAFRIGARVNLEPALRAGDRLGGHLVSGHVDGIGHIRERRAQGECLWFRIGIPNELARYIARKGSVCVDGVSLTVNAVETGVFEIQIIPHTQTKTIFESYRDGDQVNIEIDLIARYLERLIPGAAN